MFAILIFFSSCDENDKSFASPEEELTKSMESEHFIYHFSEGDYIDTTWQEQYYDWLIDTLDIELDSKLIYYKYKTRKHLKTITGRETNGFAEIGTFKFHTIWKIDNHESVHTIVTQIIGHPPALFNEGIAVAHQTDYFKYPNFIPSWNGEDFDQLSRDYKINNDIPPLENLIESKSFFDYNTNMTYPIAGSFVRYLIDNYGLQKMKGFISTSDFYDKKDITRNNLEEIYDISLDEIWDEWLNYIENYEK